MRRLGESGLRAEILRMDGLALPRAADKDNAGNAMARLLRQ